MWVDICFPRGWGIPSPTRASPVGAHSHLRRAVPRLRAGPDLAR
jgi:hypothetical protein